MPINPSILLGIKPPPNLAEMAAQQQDYRAREQERQLRTQEMQLRGTTLAEKQREVSEDEAIRRVLAESNGDVEQALPKIMQVAPKQGMAWQTAIAKSKEAQLGLTEKAYQIKKLSLEHDALATTHIAQAYQGAKTQADWDRTTASLQAADYDVSDVPPEFSPDARDGIVKKALSIKDAIEAENKRIDNERLAAQAASAETHARTTEKQAEANAAETAHYHRDMAAAAMIRAKRPPATATSNMSDVKETVAGMKDGTLPPQLPGRATKEYNAIMAEAHRQGYDLAQAVTDWNATQKHVASLNGAQQLRLNQAINQLPELLDSVDALASKWKGGRFPILNRANLAAAKNGIYGEDVASIARQLSTQIADVTADLGAVYMGGNSPTDHALKLAETALAGEWSEKVLHDMVVLAKKNVQIKHNSINNTGVTGASASNPYAQPTTPVAEEWVRDATGKLVKKGGK